MISTKQSPSQDQIWRTKKQSWEGKKGRECGEAKGAQGRLDMPPSSSVPTPPSSRFANLTPEAVAQLAERDDTVVYEPVHDTVFDPWPAQRVRACVNLAVGVARRCQSAEQARERVRQVGGDMPAFEAQYQLMFERLTQPEIARNQGHVDIVLSMIALRERVDAGELQEGGAQRLVGEQALAGLLEQAQAASSRV